MTLSNNKSIEKSNFIQLFENLLDEGYYIQILLGGYSMYPFLKNGDTVIVKKNNIDSLKVGDIIIFKSYNKLIAHRLIAFKRKNKKFLIYSKGDNLVWFDKPIIEDKYIGKIITIIKRNKLVSMEKPIFIILNKIIVFFSVISIPFLLISIPFTISKSFFKSHLLLIKK